MVQDKVRYRTFDPKNNNQHQILGGARHSSKRSNQELSGFTRSFSPRSNQRVPSHKRTFSQSNQSLAPITNNQSLAPRTSNQFFGNSQRISVGGSQHDSHGVESPGISSRNTILNSPHQSSPEDPFLDNECQEVEDEQPSDSEDDEDLDAEHTINPSVGNSNQSNYSHLNNRQKLDVVGKAFEPLSSFKKLRGIIHRHFKGPWISYRQVPKAVKLLWFLEFKKIYWWDASKDEVVHSIWKMKASEHIRTIFCKYRDKNPPQHPDWVSDEDWAAMLVIWTNDENYKRISEINKNNRAAESPNGSASYTGGSISVYAHVKKYRSEHDNQDPTMEELMQITYQKKDGLWSGTRPKKTVERYEELVQKAQDEGKEIDHIKLWIEAAGGVKKGCVFGLGSNLSDVPPELLEKYAFSQPSELYGNLDSINELQQSVSTLQNEVLGLKDQLKTITAVMEKLGSQFQSYAHQVYAPSQFHYPPAFQPLQNQHPYVGPSSLGGEAPTNFTNLLNSNFYVGMTMPTHQHSTGEIPRNAPRDHVTSSSD